MESSQLLVLFPFGEDVIILDAHDLGLCTFVDSRGQKLLEMLGRLALVDIHEENLESVKDYHVNVSADSGIEDEV